MDLQSIIGKITQHSDSNPSFLDEFKKNPIDAIKDLVSQHGGTEDDHQEVASGVAKNLLSGVDLSSVLGAVGKKDDAAAKTDDVSSKLDGIEKALGIDIPDNIENMLK